MSRKRPRPKSSSTDLPQPSLVMRGQQLCLGGTVCLLVGWHMSPCEAARSGNGAIIVMLWTVLATVWHALALLDSSVRTRWNHLLTGYGALLVWLLASVGWMWSAGNQRANVNIFWHWTGIGLGIFMLHQVIQTWSQRRALLSVFVGLAVLLCVHACYQFFFTLPAARAAYYADPEAALAAIPLHAPPGSVVRRLYEQRLNSTEPYATFALTNSLAGMLLPWILLTTTLVVMGHLQRWRRWLAAVLLALMFSCLLLTQSRAALLALLGGLALLGIVYGRRFLRLRVWLPIVAIAGLLLGGVLMLGGWQRSMLDMAAKSFRFRLEYWYSSAMLIRDYPLFGAGAGSFREFYTSYKLPQAAEAVADPHNFLVEVTACGGIPAGIILLLTIAISLWHVAKGAPAMMTDETSSLEDNTLSKGSIATIYGGAGLGIVVGVLTSQVFGYGADQGLLVWGCAAAVVTVWLLNDWVQDGSEPRFALQAGALALLVNLLAAGGIAFASVASSLWLALMPSPTGESTLRRIPPLANWACLLISLALTAACLFTFYLPVVRTVGLESQYAELLAQGENQQAADLQQTALAVDPLSFELWHDAAQTQQRLWQTTRRASHLEQMKNDLTQASQRNPRSSTLWLAIGHHYWTAASQAEPLELRQQLQQAALAAYTEACTNHPNLAIRHVQLAWAQWHTGLTKEAQATAARALELDALCPHPELKLDIQTIQQGDSFSTAATRSLNAEQVADWLRKQR